VTGSPLRTILELTVDVLFFTQDKSRRALARRFSMLLAIGVLADNTLDLASDDRLFMGMGAKFIPCC
jgi:hypothetical protein